MKTKAVLYCRVSSDEQAKGFSLDAQEQEGRAYAEKNGIEIVRVFKVAESAAHEGREKFNEAIAFLADTPMVSVLLVYKMDRAIRNLSDMTILDQLAQRHRKQIHFYHENWQYTKESTIADFYRFGFMSVISTGFSRNLSDITKVGMQKKAESGQYPGEAPFGYRNNKEARTIEPDPIEAPWVVRIKQLAAGDISLDGIAEKIKAEGCPRHFVRSAIERIVRSTFYHGLFEWGGKLYQGAYAPIVDLALHQAAVRGLERKAKGRYRKHQFSYSGIMTCDYCGGAIVAEVQKGRHGRGHYVYYHCCWPDRRNKCENRKFIRQEVLDRQVAEILDQLRVDEEKAAAMLAEMEKLAGKDRAAKESRLAWLRAEHQRISRRSDQAYEDKLDGKIEESAWLAKQRAWAEKMVEMGAEIKTLEASSVDSVSALKRVLETMNSLKSKFDSMPSEKRGQILKFVCSNPRLRGETILFSYSKPFDILVESAQFQNGVADRTLLEPRPLEVFMDWNLSYGSKFFSLLEAA